MLKAFSIVPRRHGRAHAAGCKSAKTEIAFANESPTRRRALVRALRSDHIERIPTIYTRPLRDRFP